MNIAGGIVVYLILWWTIFFAVLPWGVRGLWEDPDKAQPRGAEPGAPQDPQLMRKVLRTTWITAIVWLIVFAVIQSGIIDYRD